MSKRNVIEIEGPEKNVDPLTDLIRQGAQTLIHRAVEAELQTLLEQYSDCKTSDGKAGVVRNGYQPERPIQTGIGPVTVQIPER